MWLLVPMSSEQVDDWVLTSLTIFFLCNFILEPKTKTRICNSQRDFLLWWCYPRCWEFQCTILLHCSKNVWNYIHSTAYAVKLWLNFVTLVYAVLKNSKHQQSKTMHIISCILQYVCGPRCMCVLSRLWLSFVARSWRFLLWTQHCSFVKDYLISFNARPLHRSFTTFTRFTMTHNNFGHGDFFLTHIICEPASSYVEKMTNPDDVIARNA